LLAYPEAVEESSMNAMKSFLVVLVAGTLLGAACTPTTGAVESAAPPTVGSLDAESTPIATEVLCELVSVETNADGYATATYRATNRGKAAVEFRGFAADSPMYQREKLVDGRWKKDPLGWCGTGLQDLSLRPGKSMQFQTSFERDGQSYRFRFGEPAIVTPAVSAKAD
jgi:hypothetical protein